MKRISHIQTENDAPHPIWLLRTHHEQPYGG
jgi:hypothetical protein